MFDVTVIGAGVVEGREINVRFPFTSDFVEYITGAKFYSHLFVKRIWAM